MSKRGGGLHIDTSAFQRQAKALGAAADQLPYIASNSLNDGVFVARRALVQKVWPASVEVRNRTFLTSALEVKKASKTDLSVELKDKHGRGNLLQHAEGGVVKPKKPKGSPCPRRLRSSADRVALLSQCCPGCSSRGPLIERCASRLAACL
jgi:hypothetical protein